MRRWLLIFAFLLLTAPAYGQVFDKSPNFMVDAPSDVAARRILHDAEQYRLDFSEKWFDRTVPTWTIPVPIVVKVDRTLFPNGYMKSLSKMFLYIEILGHDQMQAERSLRHEVGHLVVEREIPGGVAHRWLQEGVCVADELLYGDYPHRFEDKIGRRPLAQFLESADIPVYANGDEFYGQAGSFVYYVRKRWGAERLWLFYEVGRKRGFEEASVWVYHMPLALLDKEWTAWTFTLDSPYPRSLRGTDPTRAPLPKLHWIFGGPR